MLLASCFMWNSASDSSDALQSYQLNALASHNQYTDICPLLSSKHINILIRACACATGGDEDVAAIVLSMDVSQRRESSQMSTDSLSLSQGTAQTVLQVPTIGHAAVGSGGAPTAGHTATSAQAMSVAPSATGIPVATDGAGGPNATNTVTRPEPVIPYQRRQEKTKWLPEEDEALKKAVDLYDAKNWKGISSYVEGKSEVQVSLFCILFVSCLMWSGTLDSYDVLLSYHLLPLV